MSKIKKDIKLTVGYKNDKNGNHFTVKFTHPTTRKQICKSRSVDPDSTESINTSWKDITNRATEVREELNKLFPSKPIIIVAPKSGQQAIADKKKRQSKQNPALGRNRSNKVNVVGTDKQCEMEEHVNMFLDRFGHVGKFRALMNAIIRHHGYEKLQSIYVEFSSIYADIKEEQTALAKIENEKRIKAAALLQQMTEAGITLEDLQDDKTVRLMKTKQQQEAQNRVERAQKSYEIKPEGYQYPVKWDGNGVMPKEFQDACQINGNRIEDFLVR